MREYLKPKNPARASDYQIPAYESPDSTKAVTRFLWGDGVDVIESGIERTLVRGRGRDHQLWVDNENLGGEPLLEVYFIDVGQGDGVLVVSPDRKHMVVDGGNLRGQQDAQKNASDFVDWKFFHDYAQDTIAIDVMVSSHCDQDHFGGLHDLLDPRQYNRMRTGKSEFDCREVSVESFYHAGVSWWKDGDDRTLGPKSGGNLTQIIIDRASVESATSGDDSPQLNGNWREFIKLVRNSTKADGTPTEIQYAHDERASIPFGDSPLSVRVLTPIYRLVEGNLVAWDLGSESHSTNGNSVMLRLDYHDARILLTADLNEQSQEKILEAYAGRETEFECDVAKACHHGSDEVDLRFLRAMAPAITVISSGDNESFDHPRPGIVAASAVTGHVTTNPEGTRLLTPLIYMTEVSRSNKLGRPVEISGEDRNPESGVMTPFVAAGSELLGTKVFWKKDRVGSRWASAKNTNLVTGIVYGLVNVRTDGHRIVSATMNEGKAGTFNIKLIEATPHPRG